MLPRSVCELLVVLRANLVRNSGGGERLGRFVPVRNF